MNVSSSPVSKKKTHKRREIFINYLANSKPPRVLRTSANIVLCYYVCYYAFFHAWLNLQQRHLIPSAIITLNVLWKNSQYRTLIHKKSWFYIKRIAFRIYVDYASFTPFGEYYKSVKHWTLFITFSVYIIYLDHIINCINDKKSQ